MIPLSVKKRVCRHVNELSHEVFALTTHVQKMVKSGDRDDILAVLAQLRVSRDMHNRVIDNIYQEMV